jgi:cytochrome o ubiquinol oxidase subunit 3
MTEHTAVSEDHPDSKTYFGFWIYLMNDCILFSVLFATYAVLHGGTYGGPTSKDLFDLPFALGETLALLFSSFTSGLAILGANRQCKKTALFWLGLTFLFGAIFLGMELHEFSDFVREGHSWRASAFLSAFFTLVGTHGLHITCGLLWILVLMAQIHFRGFGHNQMRRLSCFRLFWHFLDLVWIFIFTFVYLMGVL